MSLFTSIAATALGAALALSATAAQAQPLPAVEQLYRLDGLPTFRSSTVGMVSSHDRTGGNDDGFKGTYSFVRKEPGGLVIADLKGPGVVTRIWTPTPSQDPIAFYFDDEPEPRIVLPFMDLFSGKAAPFLAPLSGMGAGGFYTYVPLTYQRALKVVVRSEKFNFYQLNYATYPAGTHVASYSPTDASFAKHLSEARRFVGRTGEDLSADGAIDRTRVQTRPFRGTLAAGKEVTLFESKAGGRVVGLKVSPAGVLAGAGRDVVLRVYYDGATVPDIEVPAGDFFGYGWGQPATRSLLLGSSGGVDYAYLPMPFDTSIRIVLASDRPNGAIDISTEVSFTDEPRRKDEGRLYAVWRRENPTTPGMPFTFIETTGRGHLVGAIQQAQGMEPGGIPQFFEGDDQTTIDGALVVHGTGSEDFYNGGWYDVPGRWEDRVSLPFSGSLDYKRYLGRTGGYRFFVSDAYSFRTSLRQTIEHGPTGNKVPTDYASMTYLYADRRPAGAALPPPAARAVVDPSSAVYTPGFNMPIRAFSWSNATLSKHDDAIGEGRVRHLQFRATGGDPFGLHYVTLVCDVPRAGRYAVSLEAIAGPTQGRVQLFRNEAPVGEIADLYAADRRRTKAIPMGVVELDQGPNPVMFKIVGKDDRASGLGFDIHRIILERVQ